LKEMVVRVLYLPPFDVEHYIALYNPYIMYTHIKISPPIL